MRILHISERFGASIVGGAQQSVELLAASQHAAGHVVGVISVADSPTLSQSNHVFSVGRVPLRRSSATLRRPRNKKLVSLACYLYEGCIQGCADEVTEA